MKGRSRNVSREQTVDHTPASIGVASKRRGRNKGLRWGGRGGKTPRRRQILRPPSAFMRHPKPRRSPRRSPDANGRGDSSRRRPQKSPRPAIKLASSAPASAAESQVLLDTGLRRYEDRAQLPTGSTGWPSETGVRHAACSEIPVSAGRCGGNRRLDSCRSLGRESGQQSGSGSWDAQLQRADHRGVQPSLR